MHFEWEGGVIQTKGLDDWNQEKKEILVISILCKLEDPIVPLILVNEELVQVSFATEVHV